MLNAFKTLGTVLTIASTAQFGKEVYDKYKDKKRKKQIDEVHAFISELDLNALQHAIKTEDTDALIDAVESIIKAAETVKIKTDLEELSESVSSTARAFINKASNIADNVMIKATKKINDIKEKASSDWPTFDEFLKGAELPIKTSQGIVPITINTQDVTINMSKKTIFAIVQVYDKPENITVTLV